jgi:hypothetical protein
MSLDPSNLVGYAAAVLAVAAVVALPVAVVLGVVAGRLGRRLAAAEQQLALLRAEVGAAVGLGAKAGERLRRLEKVSARMAERLGQLELRGEGRPYDQAIALAQRGGDADRLVSHFGLSRSEADLLARVHGRS